MDSDEKDATVVETPVEEFPVETPEVVAEESEITEEATPVEEPVAVE